MVTALFGSFVRHGLTAAGSYMGLTGSETESLIGAVMTLIGLGWSMYNARSKK